MSSTPWRKPTDNLFAEERTDRGNKAPEHSRYANSRWTKAAKAFVKGKKCEIPACLSMATDCDHIIPIRYGGSQWDRRNYQALCKTHHAKKSGREAHGIVGESVDTPTGKIPANRAHLPQDIAGQSYLLDKKE